MPSARTRALELVEKGVASREAGDLHGSKAALDEALRLDPTIGVAHLEWAVTAEVLAVDPAVISAHYRTGARLAPKDARAQTLAADWASRQGDWEGALHGYAQAIAADPRHTDAHVRRGALLVARSEPGAAVAAYEAALAIDPESVPAWAGLAEAAEGAGRNDLAELALRRLVSLLPNATHFKARLVVFYKRHGKPSAARKLEAELERAQPKDPRTLRKLRR